ncbi:hypothetical protein CEE37_13640 [candidate division LCP-89 bacterium B3_LCP]|uniref:Fibronectin type-III domain-containing protein n=1 Tax=candidate division LCP-89 bacterium B3_LCP TaxID=2012998 RepID=A0A532URH8_UNCL8|nr:MAG: hypothetical protein CEE37_13640 [candidate division LCP-89 bacterium B3_LCP]
MSLKELTPVFSQTTTIRRLKSIKCRLIFSLLSAAVVCISGLVWVPVQAEAANLDGTTIWTSALSPYIIEDDFTIPAGMILTIEAGTHVLFQKNASLLIEGDIAASGTMQAPILFSSAAPNPKPGDWGNLRFITADSTLSYNDAGEYIKGSRLEHCIVEYGGQPNPNTPKEFLGGAVHCRKSSPYLKDIILRYNYSLQGGGIYCHEFASPYISDCLFLENEAIESGGGVACFFYSNAIVINSIFQANRCGEHGGGIYFSFSSPQIINNIIENNYAGLQGGGLFCSNTVTQLASRVRNNVLLSNKAKHKANSLYVTAKIETIFQENCLIAGEGYDVYINALEKNLDLRGNYFGPPSKSDLEARIYDDYDDPGQKSVLVDPVLESPPTELPNAPVNISHFDLAGDPSYSSDWSLPLCRKAPIYLEVRAQDRNPYHADWIPLRLRSSSSNQRGIVTLAWETGPATGIYRFQGQVGLVNSPKNGIIKAKPGETVFFTIEGIEGYEVTRPVETPKSYIITLRMPEETDTMHVVNHQPVILWGYKDIFGYEQESFQLQLSDGVPFIAPPIWDSGERLGAVTRTRLQGFDLIDGTMYALRLRINNGHSWSDWADLTLRMNSLPTMPEPLKPANGTITAQIRPAIVLKSSEDAEGDRISYELQLYQDADFQRVLAIEKDMQVNGQSVRWVAPIDLADDAEYYWRACARDPFETGPWTSAGQFWVNLIEEPPMPFGLLDPEPGLEIYQLQPVFSWEETFDPDPLSSLFYRITYSRDPQFSVARSITLETDMTFLKATKLLFNEQTYYWKVEAVDNTGLITQSKQVGNFYVNTTPTVPGIVAPLNGEELKPADRIVWNTSEDPDPDDVIQYRLQVAKNDFTKPVMENVGSEAGVVLEALTGVAQLSDDEEYLFRVRAEDNHGIASVWSDPTGLFFCNLENDPPSPVKEPVSPKDELVTEIDPIFSWGASTDVDRSDPPEKLSYVIQFDTDEDLSVGVRQVQVMAGVTRVAVPKLADNQEWFYRIAGRDDDGALSTWSPVCKFIHNTKNDPPWSFALNDPVDGWETYRLSGIEFTWQEAEDPDPYDSLTYRFHLETSTAEEVIPVQIVSVNHWSLDRELTNATEYVWWVEAVDLEGLNTQSDRQNRFRVDTTPSVPLGVFVAKLVVTGDEVFKWQPSSDPDPDDKLTYELNVFRSANVKDALKNITGIKPNQVADGIPVKALGGFDSSLDNEEFTFRVRAVDQHDAASDWSSPVAFYLDLHNESPQAPSLIEPQGELSRSAEIAVRWSAADDPDPSDKLGTMSYRLQAVTGQDFDQESAQERAVLSGATSLVDLKLEDNQLWSLRVRAEDVRGGVSVWSDPVTLLVNVEEDPPTEPKLLQPKRGDKFLTTDEINLSWSPSEDPDYNSTVHYQVKWWQRSLSSEPHSVEISEGTSYSLSGLEGDRDYIWQVIAVDDTGLQTISANYTFRVEIPNHPPQPFGLSMPDNGQEDLPMLVTLTWERSVDDDTGDEVRYTIFLAEDSDFSQNAKEYSDLRNTFFTIKEPLATNTTYYWKVMAQDREGERVWSENSETFSFRFTTAQPPEIQGEGIIPEQGN